MSTKSIADNIRGGRAPGRPREPRTYQGAFRAWCLAFAAEHAADDVVRWPSPKWRSDPVGFARDVLGVELCLPQAKIARAVEKYPRVACASGHRIGKSTIAACIALWFYCSFEDARVILTSVTDKQVNGVLWREIKRLWRRSKLPIDGTLSELARSGLKSDLREIVGYTASEAEAFQGFAGVNMLIVMDEASGIMQGIFDAMAGNRAGGARILLLGNPTKCDGEFYEAFHAKAEFYHAFQVSSEESPNVIAGAVVVPGLATREWINEVRAEHGIDSAFYKVRVLGQFAVGEDGKIISLATIISAQDRWNVNDADPDEELSIGLDPAGEGLSGDETAITAARGVQVLQTIAWRGLPVPAIVVNLIGVISTWRKHRENVRVNVDATGEIGDRVVRALRDYVDSQGETPWLTVHAIRAGDPNPRDRRNYPTMRDALWASGAAWIKSGGIPADDKLARELHCASWVELVAGAAKVTPKDDMRKALGRSPDRADSLLLAVYKPVASLALRAEVEEPSPHVDRDFDPYETAFDPYR